MVPRFLEKHCSELLQDLIANRKVYPKNIKQLQCQKTFTTNCPVLLKSEIVYYINWNNAMYVNILFITYRLS